MTPLPYSRFIDCERIMASRLDWLRCGMIGDAGALRPSGAGDGGGLLRVPSLLELTLNVYLV